MSQLKILCVSSLYPPNALGGAEIVAETLNQALQDRGHEIAVLTLGPDHDSATRSAGGEIVWTRRLRNLYWPFDHRSRSTIQKLGWHLVNYHNPMMALQASRVLDEFDPDIVITHNIDGFSPAVWKLFRRRNLPIVHVLHDLGVICPSRTMFKGETPCETICRSCQVMTHSVRHGLDQVTAVVSVSRGLQQKILDTGLLSGDAKHHVILNPLPTACSPQTRALSIPESHQSKLRVGAVGRIEHVKGSALLLEALDKLGENRPSLVLAGRSSAQYKSKLVQQYPWAADCFVGYQPIEQVCASIDVLVVPSLVFEGLGMGPLFARRHGVPSLVASIGGLPEVVTNNETGWTFPVGDSAALSAKLLALQNRPELVQSAKAACLAEDWVSIETAKVDAYEALLHECVEIAS